MTFRLAIHSALVSTAVLLLVGRPVGHRVQAHFTETDLVELNSKFEPIRHMLGHVATPEDLFTMHVGPGRAEQESDHRITCLSSALACHGAAAELS